MRRNVMFNRTRALRPEDDRVRPIHLGPRRGARIGEYASPEPNEYSDDYFGPGEGAADADANPGAGGTHARHVGGIILHRGDPTPTAWPTDSAHFGEMHSGGQSWAALQRHLSGQSGATAAQGHRGRGPKGYVRSDERLTELLCESLTRDPHLDASEVSIEVANGEVTLRGSVPDRRSKIAIEEAVADHPGVRHVYNRLSTSRPR
jgi:hypothetical protein